MQYTSCRNPAQIRPHRATTKEPLPLEALQPAQSRCMQDKAKLTGKPGCDSLKPQKSPPEASRQPHGRLVAHRSCVRAAGAMPTLSRLVISHTTTTDLKRRQHNTTITYSADLCCGLHHYQIMCSCTASSKRTSQKNTPPGKLWNQSSCPQCVPSPVTLPSRSPL